MARPNVVYVGDGPDAIQGSHFYILTLAQGNDRSESCGTLTPGPGDTVYDLFRVIRDNALGHVPGASVVSFTVQPNTF